MPLTYTSGQAINFIFPMILTSFATQPVKQRRVHNHFLSEKERIQNTPYNYRENKAERKKKKKLILLQ